MNTLSLRRWAALAAALVLTPALPAAVTTYTNYAAWAAAVGVPIHPITFQAGLGAGPFSSGITVDNVLFQGLSAGAFNGYLYQSYAGYCAPTGCLLGPATESGPLGATDGYLRSTLPGPGTVIGFDYGAFISAGDIPAFRFSNGDNYTGPAIAPGTTFLGFIADTPFNYVDYHISAGSSGGDFTVFDTVYIPTGVPEPSTWAMLLSAGVAVFVRRRRLS